MRQVAVGVLVGVSLAACLGDPVGPRGTLVVQRLGASDSVLIGAPGRALAGPVSFRLLDGAGRPVPGASVRWSIVAGHGRIAQADAATRDDGTFAAVWELGTQASEAQKLAAELLVGSHHATAEVPALAVPVEVISLAMQSDTTEVRLGVPARLTAQATDPFGNRFTPKDVRFAALDTSLAVDTTGGLVAHRRGYARVVASASGHADTATVHTIQVVQAIAVDRDTLRFHSLGQGQQLAVTLVDDHGQPVADSLPAVMASDPAVVTVQPGESLFVQSLANGVADVELQIGNVSRQVVAVVRQRTATLVFVGTALHLDALRDTIRPGLVILDSLGVPVESPHITFWSGDSAVAVIDSLGLVTAAGNGTATLFARSASGVLASTPVTVAQVVTQLTVPQASLQFEALNAMLPAGVVARDRLGSPVAGAALTYTSTDSSIVTVDASGTILARGNGTAAITASRESLAAMVSVKVAQRPTRVRADTMRFGALAETQSVSAVALDSLGSPVSGGVTSLSVSDTAVAAQVDSLTVRARANGVTTGTVTVAGITGPVVIAVRQIAATMSASVAFGKPIVTLGVDAAVPLLCQAADRNGYPMSTNSVLVGSMHGTAAGTGCDGARIERSGIDTLLLQLDGTRALVPVVIAATPFSSTPLGDDIIADTLPGGINNEWAPSVNVDAAGVVEVYYTAYSGQPDSSGNTRGDLHRLVWIGGNQFRYDGLAVAHDDSLCSPQGQGIENMVILPRSDGAGWRMLYAAGSNVCYGWQVFSAVSGDGRTWTKEPGVRVGNTGPAGQGEWPAGEGMVVDRLPDGEWRMIAGTFEHVDPAENKWAITEWRSADQLNWTYVGPVLTTRDMPEGWQGSVYSPTIRELSPGLWRMLFTADGRGTAGSRSALWSAVSTDRSHWQIEGEVLGGVGANLFYAALADDRVITIRQDAAGNLQLAIATLTMP